MIFAERSMISSPIGHGSQIGERMQSAAAGTRLRDDRQAKVAAKFGVINVEVHAKFFFLRYIP